MLFVSPVFTVNAASKFSSSQYSRRFIRQSFGGGSRTKYLTSGMNDDRQLEMYTWNKAETKVRPWVERRTVLREN